MSLLIFGCGYLGSRVAMRWQAAGGNARFVTRSAQLARASWFAGSLWGYVADITDRSTLVPQIFEDVTTILFSVGFDRSGGSIFDVYVQGLANVLDACPPSVRQVIYISTTGVYGQQSAHLDEQSPTQPDRPGSQASLAAENLLSESSWRDRSLVLRLGGIYGPHRIPRMKDILEGNPIAVKSPSWLNLVHVDDAADIVAACIRRELTGELLNVCDGQPVDRRDFYRELATLLRKPEPKFVEPSAAEAAELRGSDKRISNQRLRNVLSPAFRFPTYRDGLREIVQQGNSGR